MSAEKRKEVLARNRKQQKVSHAKWGSVRKCKERDESKRRMRKTRMNRANKLCTDNIEESPSKSFKSPQMFGKAMKKVNDALPKSPRKKMLL